MSAVRDVFFRDHENSVLEVFLKNGVTLRGKIKVWDDDDFIISGTHDKNGTALDSLVTKGSYYSIKNKTEGDSKTWRKSK